MYKVICAALAVIALCVVAAAPAHAAAATCNISGKERKLGTTYVTSLSATGVSCSKAVSFTKAFHKCRRKSGVQGRCAKLQGFSCSEKRQAIATQFDSLATCRKGSQRIVQAYTQNT